MPNVLQNPWRKLVPWTRGGVTQNLLLLSGGPTRLEFLSSNPKKDTAHCTTTAGCRSALPGRLPNDDKRVVISWWSSLIDISQSRAFPISE